jgi:hypothetical protein
LTQAYQKKNGLEFFGTISGTFLVNKSSPVFKKTGFWQLIKGFLILKPNFRRFFEKRFFSFQNENDWTTAMESANIL